MNAHAHIAAATAPEPAPIAITAKGKSLAEKLHAMQQAIQHVEVIEIGDTSHEPHFGKGSLIFMHPGSAKYQDQVCMVLKTGKLTFGNLFHVDSKAITIRGFKTGDRMHTVPLKTVKSWGRVVASYRP